MPVTGAAVGTADTGTTMSDTAEKGGNAGKRTCLGTPHSKRPSFRSTPQLLWFSISLFFSASPQKESAAGTVSCSLSLLPLSTVAGLWMQFFAKTAYAVEKKTLIHAHIHTAISDTSSSSDECACDCVPPQHNPLSSVSFNSFAKKTAVREHTHTQTYTYKRLAQNRVAVIQGFFSRFFFR